MKSIILLTVIAFSYGAKLDRGYLPPEHAQSSSGSQFLEAPIAQPIVVADDAVFHQSSAEANSVAIQRPQLNKGFVQIGSQANAFAHGVEAKAVPGYLPPKNGFVQVGSQGNSFAQGVEVSTIVAPHQPINSFVQVGNHASNLAQGVEVSTIGTPHQPINTFVQVGSHASSLAHGVEAIERVHYQGQDFKVEHRPERPQAAHERNAAILRQDYQSDGKGYAYVYETENGIYGEENGVATHGVIAQGAFSYTGDDGVKYSMTYTADEHGFQPHGDHLPTPHPIPEEILKSLEQNARDEAAGIFDDGSYHPEKYGEHATYIANDVHNENQAQAVIVNEHIPVVHAEEPAVANTLLLPETGIQRPIYRHPGFGQQLVVNVPGHIAANVNRGYLPPIHQQILAKRSSPNGKSYGTKNRQPSSNSKKVENEKH